MNPSLLLCALAAAPSDDWARFRGPDGAGLARADLPAAFTLDDARWRVALPGEGHSSPVVLGDRVVVTCVDPVARRRSVLALATGDGALLWRHDAPLTPHPQHDLNSLASATPALGTGRVHLLWTCGERLEALSLSLADGEVLWRRDLGVFSAQHGSGVSPVLAGGVLLVPNEHEAAGSFLAGLDPASGETRWRLERQGAERRGSYATPVLVRGPEDALSAIFASTAHGLTAVDPRTGQVRWQYDPGFQMRCVGSPVVAAGVVFQTAGSGGGGKEYVALRLPSAAGAAPTLAWETRLKALPYVPTSVSDGQRLFLVSDGGVATCLDAASGALRWQERVDERFFASPVLVGGRLYCVGMGGVLVVLAAADEFEVLARVDLGEPSQATPAVAGGTMYLRTRGHVIAIGGR